MKASNQNNFEEPRSRQAYEIARQEKDGRLKKPKVKKEKPAKSDRS